MTTAERFGWTVLSTPVGPITIAVTSAGLVRLSFGASETLGARLAERLAATEEPMREELGAVSRQLEEYFAGRRREFDLPLDWRLSSGLQQRVLRALYDQVGYGQPVSYQELGERTALAEVMPAHEAPRKVGGIMASNPIAVVVPCHRVIASDGGLGGFASGYVGGLEIKRRLLALEGFLPLTLDDLVALEG
jgi:methylated-DNA-[protein]-cysteine S-methyltransferase